MSLPTAFVILVFDIAIAVFIAFLNLNFVKLKVN